MSREKFYFDLCMKDYGCNFEATLRGFYHDDLLTLKDIGEIFEMSASGILKWFERYKIGRRVPCRSEGDLRLQKKVKGVASSELVKKLRYEGLSYQEVKKATGLSIDTIRRYNPLEKRAWKNRRSYW